MRHSLLITAVVAALAAACGPPHRDVPASQVPSLKDLEDVMDVQATTADPQFKKKDRSSFTPADYAEFAETSNRIQATSVKAKDWSKGPGFDELADRLHEEAVALGAAANAKDPKASSEALTSMQQTCKECHSKFR